MITEVRLIHTKNQMKVELKKLKTYQFQKATGNQRNQRENNETERCLSLPRLKKKYQKSVILSWEEKIVKKLSIPKNKCETILFYNLKEENKPIKEEEKRLYFNIGQYFDKLQKEASEFEKTSQIIIETKYVENEPSLVKELIIRLKEHEETSKRSILMKIGVFLSIYWNNLIYEIINKLLILEKESFNSIELFNISTASVDNINNLAKILLEIKDDDEYKFRNIVLYGAERSNKIPLKWENTEWLEILLGAISKFKLFWLFIMNLELESSTIFKIQNEWNAYYCILFINWKIIHNNDLTESVSENENFIGHLKFLAWSISYQNDGLKSEDFQLEINIFKDMIKNIVI